MDKELVTAEVSRIPDCDFCQFGESKTTPAVYDGKTKQGPWAFMCEAHFTSHGVGIGTGLGQKLILVK
jgi:hypothetical protein